MSDIGERGPKGDHGQHGDMGQTGQEGLKGSIGQTGETGAEGERGPTGDLGPRGTQGLVGPRGDEGKEGKVPASIVRAFIFLGATAFAALLISGCQIQAGRDYARKNRDLIQQVNNQKVSTAELRKESQDSCKNYLELRHAVNKFHSSLSGLLRAARKARLASFRRTHVKADFAAAHAYTQLLKNLLTVKRTCAQHR